MGKKFGLGEGVKGGYATQTNELIKREKDFAKALGTVDDDDPEVKNKQLEADAAEVKLKAGKENLQNLKGQLKDQKDPAVIASINANIEAAKAEVDKLENEHNKAKERLQREKQRYQLGTLTSQQEKDIGAYKKDIDRALSDYASAPDEASKAIHAKTIANLKKAIAEEEKKAGGYAAYVENKFAPGSKWWLLFQGKNSQQLEKAGGDIRDEYKKKIKSKDKPKEEKKGDDKGGDKDK